MLRVWIVTFRYAPQRFDYHPTLNISVEAEEDISVAKRAAQDILCRLTTHPEHWDCIGCGLQPPTPAEWREHLVRTQGCRHGR